MQHATCTVRYYHTAKDTNEQTVQHLVNWLSIMRGKTIGTHGQLPQAEPAYNKITLLSCTSM
jgi:hypothetical protein